MWFPIQGYGLDRNTWYFAMPRGTVEEPYKYKVVMKKVKSGLKYLKPWIRVKRWNLKSHKEVFEKGCSTFKWSTWKKKKEEESASGIAVDDVTELETLIDEIIDLEKFAEESRDSDGALKNIEEDKQAVKKLWKEAMEQFGETKKELKQRVNSGGRPNEGTVDFWRKTQRRKMSFKWKNLP